MVLAGVFWFWYRSEGTLSIHSITTTRRECFYWATVFATFALGTALGDLTAITFKLGYLGSVFLFAVVIAIPAVAWWKFRMNAILAFWFAYVVTRPLGASVADYLSKPTSTSGAGFGDGADRRGHDDRGRPRSLLPHPHQKRHPAADGAGEVARPPWLN